MPSGGVSSVFGFTPSSLISTGQTGEVKDAGVDLMKRLEDGVSKHAEDTAEFTSGLLEKLGIPKEVAKDLSKQIQKNMRDYRNLDGHGLEVAQLAARIRLRSAFKRLEEALKKSEAAGKQAPLTSMEDLAGPGSTLANEQELKISLKIIEDGLNVFDGAIKKRREVNSLIRRDDESGALEALELIEESSTKLRAAQDEVLTITLEIGETQVNDEVATDDSLVESSHHQSFNPETNLQAKQNDKNTAAANRAEETRTHNLVKRNDAAQEARIEEMKLLEEQQKNRAELKAYLDKYPKFPVTPGRFPIPEPPAAPPAA